MQDEKIIIVGDNPFQGVSHLSEQRVRLRGKVITDPKYASMLVRTAIDNGAMGFMFAANEVTLSVLKLLDKTKPDNRLKLYPLVPDVSEFARLAGTNGGVLGLANTLGKEIFQSLNFKAFTNGVKGVLKTDPASLLRSYLYYEVIKIKLSAGKNTTLTSVLLQEVVTDMALALDMDWFFRTHIDVMKNFGIKPGFETRNFSYLVKKLMEWEISLNGIVIAAPFNSIGFQMCPSINEWEETLATIPEAEVIALSILAGGYLKLNDAITYLKNLPNIQGIVVGVSKEEQAIETFRILKTNFSISDV